MKSGTLVTARRWYMPRRVYGHIVGGNKTLLFVRGNFGLEQFHRSTVKRVRLDGQNR